MNKEYKIDIRYYNDANAFTLLNVVSIIDESGLETTEIHKVFQLLNSCNFIGFTTKNETTKFFINATNIKFITVTEM